MNGIPRPFLLLPNQADSSLGPVLRASTLAYRALSEEKAERYSL